MNLKLDKSKFYVKQVENIVLNGINHERLRNNPRLISYLESKKIIRELFV